MASEGFFQHPAVKQFGSAILGGGIVAATTLAVLTSRVDRLEKDIAAVQSRQVAQESNLNMLQINLLREMGEMRVMLSRIDERVNGSRSPFSARGPAAEQDGGL